MITSFAIIFLVGLIMAFICQRIKLPRIIGMLVTGIVTGPYVLDFLDPKILGISSELRQIALIIILIKAGLSLNISDLKKIGRPAILMSFLPALFEIGAFVAFAPALLHITLLEAAIAGAVLGAILMDLSCKKLLNSCTLPAPAKTSTTPATRCRSAWAATWWCCPRWTASR